MLGPGILVNSFVTSLSSDRRRHDQKERQRLWMFCLSLVPANAVVVVKSYFAATIGVCDPCVGWRCLVIVCLGFLLVAAAFFKRERRTETEHHTVKKLSSQRTSKAIFKVGRTSFISPQFVLEEDDVDG